MTTLVSGKRQASRRQHSDKLHRIRDARVAEGMSLRTVSRRTNVRIKELQRQEDAQADLRLSTLYMWQRALRIPTGELLVEPDHQLSDPIRRRACLLRLAKTALTLRTSSRDEGVRRLAKTMFNQLLEIMPEVEDIGAWPEFGARRTTKELGRTAQRVIPEDWFAEERSAVED